MGLMNALITSVTTVPQTGGRKFHHVVVGVNPNDPARRESEFEYSDQNPECPIKVGETWTLVFMVSAGNSLGIRRCERVFPEPQISLHDWPWSGDASDATREV